MNRSARSPLILAALLLALGTVVSPAAEPLVGSPERAALLDALRPTVEADLAAPIGFRISRIEIQGGWGYVSCIPTRGAAPLDWATTKYADDFAKDMMSNMVLALLRLGDDGRWQVAEYALGPTDATWEEWIPKYELPRALFVAADGAGNDRDPEAAPIEGVGPETATAGAPPPTDVEAALDAALANTRAEPAAPAGAVNAEPAPPTEPPPVTTTRERPPERTGFEPLPAPQDPVVARNGGVGAVSLGVTRPSVFSLAAPHRIEQVMTYHYGATGRPGTIALRHSDGTTYGPWPASGAVGQGNVRNAYWWVRPDATIKPGRYTVIDSDPRSWAHEASTNGAGIYQVWGRAER